MILPELWIDRPDIGDEWRLRTRNNTTEWRTLWELKRLDRRSSCRVERWQRWPGPYRRRSTSSVCLSVCLSVSSTRWRCMLAAGLCATKCCRSVTSEELGYCDTVEICALYCNSDMLGITATESWYAGRSISFESVAIFRYTFGQKILLSRSRISVLRKFHVVSWLYIHLYFTNQW